MLVQTGTSGAESEEAAEDDDGLHGDAALSAAENGDGGASDC